MEGTMHQSPGAPVWSADFPEFDWNPEGSGNYDSGALPPGYSWPSDNVGNYDDSGVNPEDFVDPITGWLDVEAFRDAKLEQSQMKLDENGNWYLPERTGPSLTGGRDFDDPVGGGRGRTGGS